MVIKPWFVIRLILAEWFVIWYGGGRRIGELTDIAGAYEIYNSWRRFRRSAMLETVEENLVGAKWEDIHQSLFILFMWCDQAKAI